MRIWKTEFYRQEVLYVVLVHSPSDNETFSELPLLADKENSICAFREEPEPHFIWRPQAMSETHRLKLVKNQDNSLSASEEPGYSQFYVWDNVTLALFVNEQVLHFTKKNLRRSLRFCEPGYPPVHQQIKFQKYDEAKAEAESLWPESGELESYIMTCPSRSSFKLPVLVKNETAHDIRIPAGHMIAEVSLPKAVSVLPDDNKIAATEKSQSAPNVATCTSLQTSESNQLTFDFTDSPLSEEWKERITKKLNSMSEVFALNDLDYGHTTQVKHRIRLSDHTPFKQRPRPIHPSDYEAVRLHLKELKDANIIRESESPFASPIVVVKKKNGSIRLCVDYRKLNSQTIKDAYALPNIEEAFSALSGSRWFSIMDLKSGYYQVEVEEQDKDKTAFVTPMGFWEFNRMPQGVTTLPVLFKESWKSAWADEDNRIKQFIAQFLQSQKNSNGPERVLHRDLLLPCGFLPSTIEEVDLLDSKAKTMQNDSKQTDHLDVVEEIDLPDLEDGVEYYSSFDKPSHVTSEHANNEQRETEQTSCEQQDSVQIHSEQGDITDNENDAPENIINEALNQADFQQTCEQSERESSASSPLNPEATEFQPVSPQEVEQIKQTPVHQTVHLPTSSVDPQSDHNSPTTETQAVTEVANENEQQNPKDSNNETGLRRSTRDRVAPRKLTYPSLGSPLVTVMHSILWGLVFLFDLIPSDCFGVRLESLDPRVKDVQDAFPSHPVWTWPSSQAAELS
ncbi:hypothetical protein WMY93_007312 [Mugilogobius chulae]|uniref:ribonuclease H n=1 Tax=Mugilogobius chulae TaxID=88201 RepID=A0AAW0PHQ8_9GOBI